MNNYQRVLRFDNGFGLSIVCNQMSYGHENGLFEVALIKGNDLVYNDTHFQDVVGFCDFDHVCDLITIAKSYSPDAPTREFSDANIQPS